MNLIKEKKKFSFLYKVKVILWRLSKFEINKNQWTNSIFKDNEFPAQSRGHSGIESLKISPNFAFLETVYCLRIWRELSGVYIRFYSSVFAYNCVDKNLHRLVGVCNMWCSIYNEFNFGLRCHLYSKWEANVFYVIKFVNG